ncbi:immunoglobulin-like domain-containing receptor 2 isoform X2 [Scleropages formosus]|uniref:immunoglobulin-like domain-containing receptor 2 isoform X2 n=1 Tax=Scleropages formosus TaxID=113540 RepID=UPI0010FA8982|nr:immunoglobulin-like domain-containing receptor 2 isoform X2 [Scleropages formosus]
MVPPPSWLWVALLCWAGLFMQRCGGVSVNVRDKRKYAMLFQSVVLPCQYSSSSIQTPVVQWWYKSYCRDRTHDAFSFTENVKLHASGLGSYSNLDCSDSSRTVRIVASGQGSSMTLAEYYKGRDIAIINKADLRIGELQWGDSGVYFCKVVIPDDLEGKNEDQVELLVLEWVFVGLVVLGSIAFILLVGICWCQCCPHSCCCYVRCPCCPDTCCCPRHLYEAGKMAKSMSMSPTPLAMHPAYYIPSVPTMVSVAPPSLVDPKMASTPSVENNMTGVCSGYRIQASKDQDPTKVLYYIEKELAQFDPAKRACHQSCSVSELSSLHDGEPPFRQTYRQVQKAALPPIADNLDEPNHRATLSSQAHKSDHHYYYSNHREEQHQSRWNPRSEHLQRKAFGMRSRTGSLDELEEFALSYSQRGRRGEFREQERHYGTELQGRKPYPPFRDEPHHYREEEHRDDWLDRHQYQLYRKTVERDREHRRNHHSPPPPSPRKRQDTSDSELQCSRHLPGGQDYDEAYLTSLLERKARARGTRAEEDSFHSDTPSKGSSKKSSECYNSRSPSNRPEEDDSLPPYSERSTEPSARPFPHSRPTQGLSRSAQERREEREKARKVSTLLSRDSLIV